MQMEINRRVKKELGITVSIGISWNKIFAKLGSDYKKPDGITAFSKENYKELLWRLPAADLLYVGRSTRNTLDRYGIQTIGELALADSKFLERLFGKMGLVLYSFANGWDESPVSAQGYEAPIKSIGNSTTTPRDLVEQPGRTDCTDGIGRKCCSQASETWLQMQGGVHHHPG